MDFNRAYNIAIGTLQTTWNPSVEPERFAQAMQCLEEEGGEQGRELAEKAREAFAADSTPGRKTITRHGMQVTCYGKWEEDSNCVVIGTYDNGDELEEFYCDGGANWTEVVETLTAWGERKGITIEELQAC